MRSRRRVLGMICGGLGLSMLLYAGVTLADRIRADDADAPASPGAPVAASLTPVTITSVTETTQSGGPTLRLAGQAEAGSVVVLMDRGERVRQVRTDEDGAWSAGVPVPDGPPMAVEAELFVGEEGEPQISIRGEQTVFRIHRAADRMEGRPALIMISAPAEPSRIISSPFGGLPGNGPLYFGAADYDDAGGVIFSGLSEVPGRVRLYIGNAAIGDTGVGADGRWAYIASSVMPVGRSDVRAELLAETGERVAVRVPFERLPPMRGVGEGDDGALSVAFEPYRWQVRRALLGGGVQSTSIFAPEESAETPVAQE